MFEELSPGMLRWFSPAHLPALLEASNKLGFWLHPTRKSLEGLRSGDRGGKTTGPGNPIHLSVKRWFKISLTTLAVWAGVPSCCHQSLSWMFCGRWWINPSRWSSKNSAYIWAFRLPSKKCGPMISSFTIPAQTFTFRRVCMGTFLVQCGFSGDHWRWFWWLGKPMFVKDDSSPMMTYLKRSSFSRSIPSPHREKSRRGT